MDCWYFFNAVVTSSGIIKALAADTYYVRVKATGTNFTSNFAEVVIAYGDTSSGGSGGDNSITYRITYSANGGSGGTTVKENGNGHYILTQGKADVSRSGYSFTA